MSRVRFQQLAVALVIVLFVACGSSPSLTPTSGLTPTGLSGSSAIATTTPVSSVPGTAPSIPVSITPPTTGASGSTLTSVTSPSTPSPPGVADASPTVSAVVVSAVSPTPTVMPTVLSTPTPVLPSPPSGTPTPGNDTPPSTGAGCDLAVNIGVLETIPGTYLVSVGVNAVGSGACPAGTTVTLSENPPGSMSIGGLSLAYEYNGAGGWSCAGTTCTAGSGLAGNPPGNQYQVGFQTMATLSGSTTVCAAVTNTGDANAMNDTWCETLP